MVLNRQQVLEQAMKLSVEDREFLLDELEQSIRESDDAPLDAALVATCDRRMAALDRGEARAVPMEEAMAWIEQRMQARRDSR